MRADIKAKYANLFGLDRPVVMRGCDHPGCAEAGLYRAPKSRQNLYEYYWFCLGHVRDYNAAWDYYAGMNAEEIEKAIRFDTVWQRETWPMGAAAEEEVRRKMRAEFFGGAAEAQPGAAAEKPPPVHPFFTPAAHQALAVLELSPPVEFDAIRQQYKKLVKQHHPDRHGGSRAAEDQLKAINQAFTVLKAFFADRGNLADEA